MPKYDQQKIKLAAFWPGGTAGKVLVGRQVETTDGRVNITKAALLDAINALELDETNGLELVIFVNQDRSEEKFPSHTLYVVEARPKPAEGERLSPPRSRGAAPSAREIF